MSRVATVNFSENVDGDTFPLKAFNFFAADGTTPMDLSDVTAKIQIRRCGWNGKLMRTAVSGDGITWTDQSLGQMQFGGIETSTWDGAGDYYYDIQFTYATSGIIRTYIRGKITLIEDATAA